MALFKRKNKKDAAADGVEATDVGKAKSRRPASASPSPLSLCWSCWSARWMDRKVGEEVVRTRSQAYRRATSDHQEEQALLESRG
jgi:hypothetical protein